MPMPASVQQGSGQLPITSSFSVAITGTHDPSIDYGVKRFTVQLSATDGNSVSSEGGLRPNA